MRPRKPAFFNRRYATDDRCWPNYPALKGRAKIIATLRVALKPFSLRLQQSLARGVAILETGPLSLLTSCLRVVKGGAKVIK